MPATQNVPAAAPDLSALVIGVLGGTGDQGRGLALRFAMAGLKVIVGSRDAGRAATAATAGSETAGPVAAGPGAARPEATGPDATGPGTEGSPAAAALRCTGLANAEAAAEADVVIVAVP